VTSHLAATQAQEQGVFDAEISPIIDTSGKLYDCDNGVRSDANVAKLGTLKPVFDKPYGRVTAANSSQISDGACWLILASEQAVERYGFEPIAAINTVAWAGLDPSEMGLGPVYATQKLLDQQALTMADIDYWELNEAFAGQVLACLAAFESDSYAQEFLERETALGAINPATLNVDGGAVACGHPVGMSGARIVLHLAHTLGNRNAQRGVASLCIGGGQGGATLVERV